jgi:Ser/Thr protein kinase RdoA (MazF antagonist)
MNISPPVLRLPKSGRIADRIRAHRADPAIDPTTLDVVLDKFDLSASGSAHNLPHGWRNSMVRVDTEIGEIVIKRYPDRWKESTVEHEHSIVAELARQNFPSIRHHHNGSSWHRVDGSVYSATHFVAGYNSASVFMSDGHRSKLIEQSGAMLADFHNTLRRFEPAGIHHADSRPGWWEHRNLSPTSNLPAGEDLSMSPSDITAKIADLDAQLAGTTPVGVIHADFGLHNILLRRGEAAILHDFELARRDYQLADIAIAVARLPNRMTSTFLNGYRDRSPLTASDWESFDLVWRRHWYSAALRSWVTHVALGGDARIDSVRKRLVLARTTPQEKGYTT